MNLRELLATFALPLLSPIMAFPPTTWLELESWLQKLFDTSLDWPRIWPLLDQLPAPYNSVDGLVMQLERADDQFGAELRAATEELCRHGDTNWSSLSHGTLGLLGARIEILYCWVCSLQTGRHSSPRTPIPFPTVAFSEFGQWLFHDWWDEHGRGQAAEATIERWHD